MKYVAWVSGLVLAAMLTVGCTSSEAPALAVPSATPTPVVAAPSATPTSVVATPSATSTAAPQPLSWDVRVSYLTIPALGIDSMVSRSLAIPDTSTPPPGCPARPAGQETLSVPAEGIATPEEAFEGLENKAWIFGHSRWQNQPGLFHALQDIEVGDELLIDGVDRQTGEQVTSQHFVVEGIYLTDKDSGAKLITASDATEIPDVPTVLLQTSVRESGANKQWLLDREQVLSRATNLVEADLEDRCKYLLLFVIARGS
jgi:sortase (surface protein transpeptidase)